MKYIKKLKDSEIYNVKELLPTLDNQIISTKLSDNEFFCLELFSLSKGQSITPSKALSPMFYYVSKGSIYIDSKLLNKGDSICKQPNSLLSFEAIEDSIIFSLVLKKELNISNIESNNPITLKNSIDIINNSVSSKTLIQSNIISLTLLALDSDEGLSTHAASGDAMVINLEGEVNIKIDKKSFKVKENELLILPNSIPHSLKATKPFKMLLFVISI